MSLHRKIHFLMTWMAGSLPGEALAPGVPGPDVNNFPLKMGRVKVEVQQILVQVPGGAAKLSDIAKVGHYFFFCGEKIWSFFFWWVFEELFFIFFSEDHVLMAIGP